MWTGEKRHILDGLGFRGSEFETALGFGGFESFRVQGLELGVYCNVQGLTFRPL